MNTPAIADLILTNGRFHTLDRSNPQADAVAIAGGRFVAVGDAADVMRHRGDATRVIDLDGHTVIPGLNDSHLHLIRGGLNYNLELRVRDNGPGIAAADRERIFDALYSTKPHGTGVGLSISRAIVEAHGGRIECTAAEPHGALFRVVLPVRSPAALKPSAASRDHA
jgi:predicted amidohydrolase YtcJ